MIFTFFIPPVQNAEMIIEWNRVSSLNFFRSIVFVIGGSYIIGSSIFTIFFPNNSLSRRFNVDPILIKLTFYPIISFGSLGSLALIFDKIGLERDYFSLALFLSILALFLLSLILLKQRKEKIFRTNKGTKNLTKGTLFILFIAVSIIIITMDFHLKAKYLYDSDNYRLLNFSDFVGRPDTQLRDIFYIYSTYWSYIIYSISALTGLPAINTSVMLFPFIYLSITSIYILMRTILTNFKTSYAILSTVLAVSYSYLFYIIRYSSSQEIEFLLIPPFAYDAILTFRYKSFSTVLYTMSLSLFLITVKKNKNKLVLINQKREDLPLLILSSFLLMQSLMVYYLPVIPALILIFILFIFNVREKEFFKKYLTFFTSLIIFFLFFDIAGNKIFSWTIVRQFFSFLNESMYLSVLEFETNLIINSSIIYSILIGFLSINFILFRTKIRHLSNKAKKRKKSKDNARFNFIVLSIVFLSFLTLEIILNLIRTIRGLTNFTFILHTFFYYLGFIGILGIFLMYYCYKESKRLFYVLICWFLVLVGVSFSFTLYNYVKYSFVNFYDIPYRDFYLMRYWFNRIWNFTIIPVSILCSIGLIKLIKLYTSRYNNKPLRVPKSLPILILGSSLVFFSFSNTIIAGVELYSYDSILNDEEANVINWITENTSRDSKFLCDKDILYYRIKDITRRNTFRLHYEMENALNYWECPEITSLTQDNCSIRLVDELLDNRYFLELDDQNPGGNSEIEIKFYQSQNKGSFELFLETSNETNDFWINLSSSQNDIGISFVVRNGGFYYFNGTSFKEVSTINNNLWYHLKFYFECTDSNYYGLNQYNWKVTINQSMFGGLNFINNVSNIGVLTLATDINQFNYSLKLRALNFIWNPDFNIERCFLDYLKIFDYLEEKNINFLILSKEDTEFKLIAEELIDIYSELVPMFYSNTLYEYGNLTVYSASNS